MVPESLLLPGKDQSPIRGLHELEGGPLTIAERNQHFFTDLPQFRMLVADAMKQWSDTSPHDALLISLDGLSGSGKTTLAGHIREVMEHVAHATLHELPIDLFITTSRDDPMRVLMTENAELFWRYVYSRGAMKDVLSRIAHAPGESLVISEHVLYNRERGEVAPGTITVPPGRKVVLVDGIDSTRILRELSEFLPCPQLRIFYHVRPDVALRRVVRRDTRQGRRTLEENRAYREREYRHLVPQLMGENMGEADIVYVEGG